MTICDKFNSDKKLHSLVISSASIKPCQFYFRSDISSITITDAISIEEFSFAHCKNLKSVEICSNISSLNKGTFFGCSSLEDIIIPDSVKIIEDETFKDCKKLKTF